MPKREAPLEQLQQFLPAGSFHIVKKFLNTYKIHLTISRQRSSILGDYRHRTPAINHRISINGNLNPYTFLITLMHEAAHLLTYEKFAHTVAAHGKEWKSIYAGLISEFLGKNIFPPDIRLELQRTMSGPAATSCAEDGLIRVLRNYDQGKKEKLFVEELPMDGLFKLDDGRIFKRGKKQRKRFECREISSGKIYLFSPVHEVKYLN